MTYIVFVPTGPSASGKTRTWAVQTKDVKTILGTIKWFASWRKYAFFPEPACVFEHHCLREIAAFIETQSINHRNA